MKVPPTDMARQIGDAISAFEQRTGSHLPESMNVVLSDHTLVITLRGALSPIEHTLAQCSNGAAQLQEFHRDLFADKPGSLRHEIKRITGMSVSESLTEVEPPTGAVVKVSTSGTVVHVLLLEGGVPSDTWSGKRPSQLS